MKLKAHVGEFGGADEVKRTVEVLQLDEVQHGIAAAESTAVMNWLADNRDSAECLSHEQRDAGRGGRPGLTSNPRAV